MICFLTVIFNIFSSSLVLNNYDILQCSFFFTFCCLFTSWSVSLLCSQKNFNCLVLQVYFFFSPLFSSLFQGPQFHIDQVSCPTTHLSSLVLEGFIPQLCFVLFHFCFSFCKVCCCVFRFTSAVLNLLIPLKVFFILHFIVFISGSFAAS